MKKFIWVIAAALVLSGVNFSCKAIAAEDETALEIIAAAELPDEQSAVDVTPKKKRFWQKNKDENIVEVVDLRGGVEKEEGDKPLEAVVEESVEPKTPLQGWLEGDYMTGDWGGWRTKLEEHGVTFEAMYLNDTMQRFYGGIEKSRYPIRNFGLIDTAILLDTEKLGLWKNGQFVVRYQFKRGSYIGDSYIGAYQYVDAYDAGDMNQVAEYWYEQGFFDNKIQIKVGKQDACYDFMMLDLATNFVNNSHAFFMPNVPLPAYPDQAMGLVLKINPTDWLSFRTGWYDGKAKGSTTGFNTAFGGDPASFLIQEIGIRHNKNNMPGTILAGGWLHTGHVDTLSNAGGTKGQTLGTYIEAEQMIWKKLKDDAEDTQGLYALLQYSYAPENRSEIENYYGGTLMFKGPLKDRPDDIVGVGAAIAQFGGNLRNLVDDGRKGVETILEAFYKIQMTPWLSLQPVAQFILRPNGSAANSFVMGFRTCISF